MRGKSAQIKIKRKLKNKRPLSDKVIDEETAKQNKEPISMTKVEKLASLWNPLARSQAQNYLAEIIRRGRSCYQTKSHRRQTIPFPNFPDFTFPILFTVQLIQWS